MRIVIAGGSGYLGSTIVQELLIDGHEIINLSRTSLLSKSGTTNRNLIEYEIELNSEKDLIKLSSSSPFLSELDGVINLAGKSLRGVSQKFSVDEFSKSLLDGILPTFNTVNILNKQICRGGSVVNFGSLWGLVSPKLDNYLGMGNEPSLSVPASKAAIMQLTKYWSTLFADRSIRVNNVIPGWFPAPRGEPREDYLMKITSSTPLARIGRPQDLVGVVKFLLSDASKFVTGQNLIVDGGYLAW